MAAGLTPRRHPNFEAEEAEAGRDMDSVGRLPALLA
jgi:hypothetical protein